MYFTIDFITPLWVSQSPFGKDTLQVKIYQNDIITDEMGSPLKRFNQPKTLKLDPMVASIEEKTMIEESLGTAQLFIMFLQANMLVLNVLLSKSLQDLWGMLNT